MAKVITFGEIMLRLATPGYLRFNQAKQFEATFGGGEANVAVSLANYGIEAEFVTRFPKNDIAASCIKDLHSYGTITAPPATRTAAPMTVSPSLSTTVPLISIV